jgi:hypothetical protein
MDNQVSSALTVRLKKLSKSKQEYSLIPKDSSAKKLDRDKDSGGKSVLGLKYHKKLSLVNTLIRSAHSLVMFQSEEESLSK